jgi:hypothetical protein
MAARELVNNQSVSTVSGVDLALLALGVVVVIGLVLLVILRSRWAQQDLTRDLGVDVDTGLALLRQRVDDLAGVEPDGPAALALRDARGRLAAAQEMRERGENLLVLKAGRRVLLEGLVAVAEGDRLAGRDPGPDVPAPTATNLVPETVRVRVGDTEHIAQPAYVPGFPYHFPGADLDGDEVPGGWYSTPFWTDLLDPTAD